MKPHKKILNSSFVRQNFKIICITLITTLLSVASKGQCGIDTNILRQRLNENNKGYKCALGKAYILSKQYPDTALAAMTPPSGFPPSAIFSCGHFSFYYDDVMLGLGIGYDAGGGLGTMRQNNLCQVVDYLESVFDFSKVPSGGIRIHVERSDWHSYLTSGTWGSAGMPFYNAPGPGCPTVKGFVADYVQSGSDPSPFFFHGQIGIDFSMPNINSDASITSSCDIDLFTMHLHEMGHVLGFFSFIDPLSSSTGVFTTVTTPLPALSKVDRSLCTTPHPYTSLTAPFTPTLTPLVTVVAGLPVFSTTPGAKVLWLNGKQPPYNESVEFTMNLSIGDHCPVYKSSFIDNGLHINDNSTTYGFAQRLSPGDQENYVLGPKFHVGEYRREFMKGEIEEFKHILNYEYNPVYELANAVTIANSKPHSAKMGSVAYSMTYANATTPEAIAADYSIINNIGTTLTINLSTLGADLKDADGDPLSVFPGSLVNFRGCGDGGNNHNQLVLSGGNQIITYTPRPNFYGRAQFGFNLFDGKEKGGFVIFTIDVARGTNVNLPASGDMVLNGSFEEGSEVKIVGSAASESINNSLLSDAVKACRISSVGAHLADSHPWDFMTNFLAGHSIYQSNGNCNPFTAYSSFLNDPFGGGRGSFYPYTEPAVVDYPISSPGGGNRYQPMTGEGSMFYLAHCLKTCKTYKLTFFGKRTGYSPTYTYPAMENIEFGFLNDAHLSSTLAVGSPLLPLPFSPTAAHGPAKKAFTMSTWNKAEITFNYCETDSLNILYLNAFDHFFAPASFIIDSVRLFEVPPALTTVNIQITYPPVACQRLLEAFPIIIDDGMYGCGAGPLGFNYSWTKSGSPTVIGTSKTLTVEPLEPTTYIVTVDDGCGHSASQSITVSPCKCSPYVVFGNTTSFNVLSGTIATSIPAGLYYVANDLTLPSSISYTGANMLIKPGVQINVGNNAKLTIENSHLFTCPDSNQLWKGIDLLSSGSTSGRLEMKNNSMIEDAQIAIRALNPRTPGSGNIIETNTSVFNRNNYGIWIENYTYSTPTTYPFVVKSTVFTSRNLRTYPAYPLSWSPSAPLSSTFTNTAATAPYVLCRDYSIINCKNGTLAYNGIRLTNVGAMISSTSFAEVVIGDGSEAPLRNLFDRLGDGIAATNSNVTLYNNVFANMVYASPITSFVPTTATGISASGRFNRLRVLGLSGQYVNENRFYDCNVGINANLWSLTSSRNLFQTSNITAYYAPPRFGLALPTGIRSTSSQYDLRQADQNKFYNVPTGILMNSNAYSGFYFGQTNITSNTFQSQPPSPVAFNASFYTYQGIALDNVAWAGKPGTLAGNNTISNNTLTDVFNGIALQGNNRINATLSSNTITLRNWGGANVQYGMSFTGSAGATVGNLNATATSNSVTGLGAAFNNDRVRGYYASFNTNLKLCSNSAFSVGRGFEFAQTTAQVGTRWIANTMNNNLKGIVLGSDIGHQGFTNNWSTMTSYYAATLNQWTGSWTTRWQTFAENSRRTNSSNLWVRGGGFASTELPNRNWCGSVFCPYPLKYDLAGSLRPTTLTSNCDGAIYPIKVVSLPWDLKPLALRILADSLGDDTVFRRNQWMAQLSLYEMTRIDSTLRDSSNVLDSFMVATSGSRFQWLMDIEEALADSNISAAEALLAAPVAAMGRVVVSPDVVITDYSSANTVVNNYSTFYTIYLHYLQNIVSANDSNDLEILAQKCPAKDGAVVYKARSLYSLFNGHYIVYNDDSCKYDASGNFYRFAPDNTIAVDATNQRYALYPNPNDGSFSIKQFLIDDKEVMVKLYDALGRMLMDKKLNFINGKVNLQLPQAFPGQYVIYIDDGAAANTRIKFTVK